MSEELPLGGRGTAAPQLRASIAVKEQSIISASARNVVVSENIHRTMAARQTYCGVILIKSQQPPVMDCMTGPSASRLSRPFEPGPPKLTKIDPLGSSLLLLRRTTSRSNCANTGIGIVQGYCITAAFQGLRDVVVLAKSPCHVLFPARSYRKSTTCLWGSAEVSNTNN